MNNDLNRIFYGPTPQSCPACGGSDDWHPDPSGPTGQTWMVCEYCAYVIDHKSKGRPDLMNKDVQI